MSSDPPGNSPPKPGPLTGYRFVELAGIGPVPFASMLLADLGATGVRVARPDLDAAAVFATNDPRVTGRGRKTVTLDARTPEGTAQVLDLVRGADLLLEGFRPGVMERLGLGPKECLEVNPRLVYCRMTGWGQTGPLAGRAGHDLNYLAVSGALRHCARAGEKPVPPLNLVADYGGGAMMLVTGALAALLEVSRTGRGRVIDGAALLTSQFHELMAQGSWNPEPGHNLIDTGAPFYDLYECADRKYIAVGALEPRFYAELLAGLDVQPGELPDQYDRGGWPAIRARFTELFFRRTRDEWATLFEGTDACVSPVLGMDEAPHHRHLVARNTFVSDDGVVRPAPAPRFN